MACWFINTSVLNVCLQVPHVYGNSGLWSFSRCNFKRYGLWSVILHSSHLLTVFSFERCGWDDFVWPSNSNGDGNFRGHFVQWNLLFGSWNFFRWVSKADGWLKDILQISHLYGLTSLWCTLMWTFKCATDVNVFEHFEHMTLATSVCDLVLCCLSK